VSPDANWVEHILQRVHWVEDNFGDYGFANWDMTLPARFCGSRIGGGGWPTDEASVLIKRLWGRVHDEGSEGLPAMTTTRKDLNRLAEALRIARPEPPEAQRYLQWVRDVRNVADALEVTTGFTANGNRSFDRDRFYRASGLLKEAE
jgi:hypothetical protein